MAPPLVLALPPEAQVPHWSLSLGDSSWGCAGGVCHRPGLSVWPPAAPSGDGALKGRSDFAFGFL